MRILSVLDDRVRLLEHVGSTAVPGLAAKPIIDIVLAVGDAGDEDSYLPDLEAHGYTLLIREPDWYEHRLIGGPTIEINLHVFTDGSKEIERMILFRDHLRTDTADRQLYEQAKRRLAGQTWEHIQDYADAKSPVVADIMNRALARSPNSPTASNQRRRQGRSSE